jgi:hypothetical protein
MSGVNEVSVPTAVATARGRDLRALLPPSSHRQNLIAMAESGVGFLSLPSTCSRGAGGRLVAAEPPETTSHDDVWNGSS